MNNPLACVLCAVLTFTFIAPTYAIDTKPVQALELKVSRQGDLELSCGSLSQEALTMRDIVNTTQNIKEGSALRANGITAAGAIGSFLVGTATGGIGLAAAGFLLERNVDTRSQAADDVQDIAEQRRSLMLGVYNAKGCYGPTEHVMQNADQAKAIQLAALDVRQSNTDAAIVEGAPALTSTAQTSYSNEQRISYNQ